MSARFFSALPAQATRWGLDTLDAPRHNPNLNNRKHWGARDPCSRSHPQTIVRSPEILRI